MCWLDPLQAAPLGPRWRASRRRQMDSRLAARADDLGGKRRAVAQRRCRRPGSSKQSTDVEVPLLGTRRGHHQLPAGRSSTSSTWTSSSRRLKRRVTSVMVWCMPTRSQLRSKASGTPMGPRHYPDRGDEPAARDRRAGQHLQPADRRLPAAAADRTTTFAAGTPGW